MTQFPSLDVTAMIKAPAGRVLKAFFDAEALARMPAISRRIMIEPEVLIDATFRALARGKREITVPWFLAPAYVVRAIAPGFLRRNTRRSTLGAAAKPPRSTAAPPRRRR